MQSQKNRAKRATTQRALIGSEGSFVSGESSGNLGQKSRSKNCASAFIIPVR